MASYKVFVLLFALIFLAKAQEDFSPEFHDVEEDMSALDEGRMLSSSYSNMRIHANFDLLHNAPSSFRSYIQNELVPPIVSYFESALRVKYPVSGKLKVTTGSVCGSSTPNELRNGVDADYTILYNSESISGTVVASSRACVQATGTKRPIVGTTVINRNQLQPANGDVLVHEKNMYVLMHELMHTFAFSAALFPHFLDNNGNVLRGHVKTGKLNGKTHTIIDLPVLTQKLRNFYGCSSLPGAYMENDGGDGTAGTHFERKIFLYETMCSGGIFGRRISQFSLSFLEGSGWYLPNYDYAEPFYYGQGQGCGFISATSNSNSQYDEFCTGSNRGCANTGIGGGYCQDDSKTEGVKYIEPNEEYLCENPDGDSYARLSNLQVFGRGAGSKCFTGTLNSKKSNSVTSFCFKTSCSGSGSNTELTLQVGNKNVRCDREGQVTVDGYYGSINCPDPLHFCSTVGKAYCPRGCMGRGSCVNNRCVCRSGYSGVDCALDN